jgi:thioredoxin 1
VNASRKIIIVAVVAVCLGIYFGMGCANDAKMNESTANVDRISPDKFAAEVIQSTNLVVVDFYATWCGPCRVLSPMLDRLAASFTNNIKFVKVNLDEAPELAQKYSVEAIPTLLFFKRGELTDRMLGLQDEMVLKAKLATFAADK